MSGLLQPGRRLTMRGIAAALDVSVTPAREAIHLLVAEKALQLAAPRTVIVPRLDQRTYLEIIRIRMALETMACEMALPRITRSDIDQLKAINAAHYEAIEARDVSRILERNEAFHFSIYRRADMPNLIDIIESQWLRIGPTFNLLYPQYERGRRGNMSHTAAIEAIENGDVQGLKNAIIADISQAREELLPKLTAD